MLRADQFRKQLESLDRWGYTSITFADYLLIRSGELSPPRKPIVLTFDDGYADTFTTAFPILQEFGMRAVVFVAADPSLTLNVWDDAEEWSRSDLLNESQILQLHDAGFEIGSHSMTHARLPLISREKAWEEILHSRMRLEILLNSPVQSFAYPYGLYNDTLKQLVQEAGYKIGCAVGSGPRRLYTDSYEIRRIGVSNARGPVRFAMKVAGPYPTYRSLTGRTSSVFVSTLVKKHVSQARTLLLVTAGLNWPPREELLRREENDECPRITAVPSALNADVLNEKYLQEVPWLRRVVYRFMPVWLVQITEAFIVRGRYDAVVSWAEHLGIPFAAFLKLTFARVPHVAIFSWISKPKKAIPLKLLRSRFSRIILMSSVQRDYARDRLGISDAALPPLRWPVDQKFWHPVDVPQEMICAVGREMRDYGTLVEALRGSTIRCHIAAGGQVGMKKKDAWVTALSATGSLPPNITLGPLNFAALRAMYARSRFVVMPLFPTKTDNGTTSILEAMAMGKAVICSRVEGQKDVIRDGETGLFVPPQDPSALRAAIDHLWNHPEMAEKMGQAARAYVLEYHTLDAWVTSVRMAVEESIQEERRDHPESKE
jgi:peptidoglycan/xylan/chitin deacetylase (PgdA/CDA1 family)